MIGETRRVSNVEELAEAAGNVDVSLIMVVGSLDDVPTVRLGEAQAICGTSGSKLTFRQGVDGIELCAENQVTGLELVTDVDRRVIYNDTGVTGFGRLTLERLRVTGCVRLTAGDNSRGGHVHVKGLHIVAADARHFEERPSGFGVEVVPGCFTVWNRHIDPESRITAHLTGLAMGAPGAPVLGGGVFVGGTPGGGRTMASLIETGEIHSDGGIAPGTPDRISGGVFVVHGAWVDLVHNTGSVTTYGPNDMVLDNWGSVERWQADAKITSYGPSGIGFVNFGEIGVLRVDGAIETFGLGARGFNVYAGTVRDAEFERVVTRADGAVGIQISQPVGRIAVRHGVETFGGVGASLVKGVVTDLPAIGLSVKPGGHVREIVIDGGVTSHGDGIESLELHGIVDKLRTSGGIGPAGSGFVKI